MNTDKLSEQEIEAIREESRLFAQDMEGVTHPVRQGIFIGYKAAATAYTLRAKGLEEWKRQQLIVMEQLDLQAIGKELGIGLGEDISSRVLPEIRRLKRIIQQLQPK